LIEVLSDTEGAIAVSVPHGTNLNNLTAQIELAAPSITPLPGAARSYSLPVAFTVYPEEGVPRVYTVTAAELPNTEVSIESISVNSMTGVTRSADGQTITVSLPYGTNISSITPSFVLSMGAQISPAGAQNFATATDNAIVYTVRAANPSTTADYTVKMKVAANDAKRITGFGVAGVRAAIQAIIETMIDDTQNKINVRLPSGLSKTFTPEIPYEGSSMTITPYANYPVDFSSGKTYRVTAADGSTRDYTVSVSVKNPVAATLNGVVANGTPGGAATTQLTLNFSHNVTTLAVENITLEGGSYTKGALVKGTGNSWVLDISGNWAQSDMVTISAAGSPIGYSLSGSASASLNREPELATFSSVTANGSSGTATTALTLIFSKAIPGLGVNLSAVDGSIIKGSVGGSSGTYTLTVSGIETAAASMSVTVTPAGTGYTFIPSSLDVTVFKKLSKITYKANGPSVADITTNPLVSHTINDNSFTNTGKVFKEWNTLADGTGMIYHPAHIYTGSNDLTLYAIWLPDNANLATKFGTTGVAATFNAVAAYLRTTPKQAGSGATMSVGAIKIGDYVTLPSLSVAVYGTQGSPITGLTNQKVKVVGINPYTNKNLNTAGAHLVFQFENIVTTRRIHSNANVSYSETELRRYLTPVGGVTGSGNFYTGLVNAGVPADVFWAPMRVIGAKNGGSTESLQDKVFLPTFYEVFGSNMGGEESGNQGRLSAYHDENSRKKSGAGIDWWWLASPFSGSSSNFCAVATGGGAAGNSASTVGGCPPVFCVKSRTAGREQVLPPPPPIPRGKRR
jgi:hypothetical protein